MGSTIMKVQGYNIAVEYDDYICLTDMAKADGDGTRAAELIRNWLRNKSTLNFLAVWEGLYNPNFKVVEFEHFKNQSGSGDFSLSVDQWADKTGAIGIYSRKGRNGGTYAHKDIAFEFGTAISPAFKLHLIREFQRLKEQENKSQDLEWSVRRVLSKAVYQVQTDAIKEYKIPINNIPVEKQRFAYSEEGDILNLVMFGFTAKQWREANIKLAGQGKNVRDYASVNELSVLTVLEGVNADMIKYNRSWNERYKKLVEIKSQQMKTLENVDIEKSFKRLSDGTFKPFFKKKHNRLGMFPENPDQVN